MESEMQEQEPIIPEPMIHENIDQPQEIQQPAVDQSNQPQPLQSDPINPTFPSESAAMDTVTNDQYQQPPQQQEQPEVMQQPQEMQQIQPTEQHIVTEQPSEMQPEPAMFEQQQDVEMQQMQQMEPPQPTEIAMPSQQPQQQEMVQQSETLEQAEQEQPVISPQPDITENNAEPQPMSEQMETSEMDSNQQQQVELPQEVETDVAVNVNVSSEQEQQQQPEMPQEPLPAAPTNINDMQIPEPMDTEEDVTSSQQPLQQQLESAVPEQSESMQQAELQQVEQQHVEMEQVEQSQSETQEKEAMNVDEEEEAMQPTITEQQEQQQRVISAPKPKSNTVKNVSNSSGLLPELLECGNLLNEFMRRPESEPFNEPVDWKGLNLPDYPLIITKPMDLGTVMKKLENNKYSSADTFAADIRLVFKNAKTYNTPGSGIFIVAENLHKQFERRYARITKNVSLNKKRKSLDRIKNQKESTFKDRQTFTTLIQSLTPQELGGVVELIDKKSPMAINDHVNGHGNEDELEIEVYHIDAQTLKDLINHCEKVITKRGKKKKKGAMY